MRPFLDPALAGRLEGRRFGTHLDIARKQVVALVEHVDRFANGLFVVLVGEEGQVVEFVVGKSAFELHRRPSATMICLSIQRCSIRPLPRRNMRSRRKG